MSFDIGYHPPKPSVHLETGFGPDEAMNCDILQNCSYEDNTAPQNVEIPIEHIQPRNEIGHGKLKLNQSTVDKKMQTFNRKHRGADERVKQTTAMAR